MGEVLLNGETPTEIWDQHEAILNAVIAGDTNEAERLARHHISQASETLDVRLAAYATSEPVAAPAPRRARKRAAVRQGAAADSKV